MLMLTNDITIFLLGGFCSLAICIAVIIFNKLRVHNKPLAPDDYINGEPIWYTEECPYCNNDRFIRGPANDTEAYIICTKCRKKFIYNAETNVLRDAEIMQKRLAAEEQRRKQIDGND